MFREDLSVFFDINGFAEVAAIAGQSYPCIFDEDYSAMNLVGAEGRQITAYLKTSDVKAANVKHGTAIAISGKNFRVKNIMPTGDGKLTDLELTEL